MSRVLSGVEGAACVLERTLTTNVVGTHAYCAPELLTAHTPSHADQSAELCIKRALKADVRWKGEGFGGGGILFKYQPDSHVYMTLYSVQPWLHRAYDVYIETGTTCTHEYLTTLSRCIHLV